MNKELDKMIKNYEKQRLKNAFLEFTDDELGIMWFCFASTSMRLTNKKDKKQLAILWKGLLQQVDQRKG